MDGLKISAKCSWIVIEAIKHCDNIYQTRLLGWVIAKAQTVLKLYNKDLGEINLEHAMGVTMVTLPARLLLSPGDKETSHIKLALGLANKTIAYKKDDITFNLNIIAFPQFIDDGKRKMLRFYIHKNLWHALLDMSKGWRVIDMLTFQRLSSKYSAILYMLVSNQKAPITLSLGALKDLTGAQSYNRGNNFITRVILASQRELDEKAPTSFDFNVVRGAGKGRPIVAVEIRPRQNNVAHPSNKENLELVNKVKQMRVNLDERVQDYLHNSFQLESSDMEKIEVICGRLGSWQQQINILSKIRESKDRTRPKNPKGYLIRAIQKHLAQQ